MEEEIILIMAEVFKVPRKKINKKISFGKYQKWDSLKHITLVTKLENSFDLIFEPEEINEMLDLNSIIKTVREKTYK